ncbi:Multiple PDZ domain protein [Frankliniella fusca]|uniref:Multiple PDZ domain protein n=1 Tax=Frankliniella fusca TaxID=407009 RepID=A0AAE1LVA1_9NEOP|nr:Multiple PDZ domain protein [Frankliniella fusca]
MSRSGLMRTGDSGSSGDFYTLNCSSALGFAEQCAKKRVGYYNKEFVTTTNGHKIRKRYGPAVSMAGSGGSVELAVLERGNSGLGLSLAGHKDRARMAVLVCGLNPNGAAYKNGDIKVGDEILEVNGVVLQGRCHLNASAIIKGLPGPVFKVVLLRREAAVEELAVKPLTQFPVSLDDETPEERYKDFKGLRTVLIKKPCPVETSLSSLSPHPPQVSCSICTFLHAFFFLVKTGANRSGLQRNL